MKTIITAIIAAVVAAGGVFLSLNMLHSKQNAKRAANDLLTAQETVQKRLDDFSARLESQLRSFAEVVAANKEFSLRILAENDRSAPAVTEMAAQFLGPMGFSVLEITDSSRTILSSGHFPASAGNKSMHRAGVLSKKLSVTTENIMGTATLTMQAEYPFSIAGFNFYVSGGIAVDTGLLEILTPNSRVELLLKDGDRYLGIETIASVSQLTNNEIIIDGKKHRAAEIDVPVSGNDRKISLIMVMKQRSGG